MAEGSVTVDLDPTIDLAIYSFNGARYNISVIVDTGFRNELALPKEFIEVLQLPRGADTKAKYANGSDEAVPTYLAEVEWNGQRKYVTVISMAEAFIGMTFMLDFMLTVHVKQQGKLNLVSVNDNATLE